MSDSSPSVLPGFSLRMIPVVALLTAATALSGQSLAHAGDDYYFIEFYSNRFGPSNPPARLARGGPTGTTEESSFVPQGHVKAFAVLPDSSDPAVFMWGAPGLNSPTQLSVLRTSQPQPRVLGTIRGAAQTGAEDLLVIRWDNEVELIDTAVLSLRLQVTGTMPTNILGLEYAGHDSFLVRSSGPIESLHVMQLDRAKKTASFRRVVSWGPGPAPLSAATASGKYLLKSVAYRMAGNPRYAWVEGVVTDSATGVDYPGSVLYDLATGNDLAVIPQIGSDHELMEMDDADVLHVRYQRDEMAFDLTGALQGQRIGVFSHAIAPNGGGVLERTIYFVSRGSSGALPAAQPPAAVAGPPAAAPVPAPETVSQPRAHRTEAEFFQSFASDNRIAMASGASDIFQAKRMNSAKVAHWLAQFNYSSAIGTVALYPDLLQELARLDLRPRGLYRELESIADEPLEVPDVTPYLQSVAKIFSTADERDAAEACRSKLAPQS